MHNKMMFVQVADGGQAPEIAWAYVGSHNLSESAVSDDRQNADFRPLGMCLVLTDVTVVSNLPDCPPDPYSGLVNY